ncbi:NAD-dependent epimerase/dehydratase family protein [Actinocorallia sp. API 0066]|uniref:NAD-dependent epimerase/dehydratase family protein n=1 Tax=Actinocorallia sp. API 0066 TaxID=2896846 RepID=UPI001E63C2D2|nr:NAD-dependent epimerase/dehydratase family protein [Actinocorallia sp. API 0066]MCD0450153.1 NAD-dependent epimerase/dehydratase family protein [Actinocorallia sp. API 0066]
MPLDELAGARVLVTGAGGLIGSRLTARLRQVGAFPVSVCKFDAYPIAVYLEHFGISTDDHDFHVGDVAEPGLVRRVMRGCDYVIHAAALADVAACTRRPFDAIKTNIVGTQRVLEAAAATETVRRVVFVSSASVYGNRTAPSGEFSEEAALAPLSVYGSSKAWGEFQTAAVLAEAGLSHTIVRYFSVYGEPQTVKENSHSWVVAWFCMRASLGLPLQLNGGGHQVRDFVHVDDIAVGTLRALIAPAAHNQTINIGSGRGTTIREIADLVRLHYPDVPFAHTPLPPGDPLGGFASTRRMADLLEWRPEVTVASGVARYAAWLGTHPAAIPAWLSEPVPHR